MNSRYLAYCRARKKSIDETMQADAQAYPGGVMAGFIQWISTKWEEWTKETGAHPYNHSEKDHNDFDVWLDKHS